MSLLPDRNISRGSVWRRCRGSAAAAADKHSHTETPQQTPPTAGTPRSASCVHFSEGRCGFVTCRRNNPTHKHHKLAIERTIFTATHSTNSTLLTIYDTCNLMLASAELDNQHALTVCSSTLTYCVAPSNPAAHTHTHSVTHCGVYRVCVSLLQETIEVIDLSHCMQNFNLRMSFLFFLFFFFSLFSG